MGQSYISYWEADSWLNDIDITIIGSGIVGLSSAYFIKKAHPEMKVVVVERGFLPHGATSRNAGFSCFGSPSEILADIKLYGKEKAYQLVKERYDGLQALQALHPAHKIHYHNFGGYEVFKPSEKQNFEEVAALLGELNKELAEVLHLKQDIYTIMSPNHGAELGLTGIDQLIYNPYEGQLHSGNLVKSLLHLCHELDIEIITGLDILELFSSSDTVYLTASHNVSFKSRYVLVANNGFANKLVPELDLKPARGQVLVTTPIPNLKLKGTFHHNQGFDYFRNIDNRVLLGGGRNIDIEKEETTEMDRNDKIYDYLISLLENYIIQGQEYKIDYEWSGTMGVGQEKSPIIKFVNDNILVAVRMGGMGVALGTSVGKKVAEMLH